MVSEKFKMGYFSFTILISVKIKKLLYVVFFIPFVE